MKDDERQWDVMISLLTGQVDERTMRKYEIEAKEKKRESWALAFIVDTNEEERDKGKTVEVGRAHFTTANKRFTLLDCPGHNTYVRHTCSVGLSVSISLDMVASWHHPLYLY